MADRVRRWALRATALAFPLILASPARAEPRPAPATVVWARDDRAYLAPADSTSLTLRTLVSLWDRKRAVASGEVVAVQDHELAVVRLTSGSLRKVKHLDRLTILAEAPVASSRPMLRLGAPSHRRSSLLVRCAGITVSAPCESCVVERLADDRVRVRAASGTHGPWPDTLLVRLFDDATDEEIALERGDIDAAMFWPGELSAHVRDDPRWTTALGTRARGYVAGRGHEAAVSVDSLAHMASGELAAMNTQLFRGDLDALVEDPSPADSARGTTRPIRILVDASIPGQRAMQRFLDRSAPGAGSIAPALDLVYRDEAVPDPVPGATPTNPAASGRPVPLFALRCPVVFGADANATVRAIGPDALVNLLGCEFGAR